MTTRTVLAIDGGRAAGLAFDRADGASPFAETLRLPEIGGGNAEGWDYGPALLALRRHVEAKIRLVLPDVIAIEAPLMPFAGNLLTREVTVRLHFGIAATIEVLAQEYGLPFVEKNVKRVKKYWAGHGGADKSAMMARCRQLGWPVRNDHEADAAALWAMVKAEADPRWRPGVGTPIFSQGGAA